MAPFHGADTVVCFQEAWSSLLGWLATNPRVTLFFSGRLASFDVSPPRALDPLP